MGRGVQRAHRGQGVRPRRSPGRRCGSGRVAHAGAGVSGGGGKKKAVLSVAACPPARAWRVLFAAASTGGAYNSGCHGAYGRLAAWQSLAALAGVADGADAAEAEARVSECAWFGFDAATDWFERVAWDIGLATLSPDGRRLAVLAATDTS
ncbi:DUF6183 family protein [Streptomyces albidoflavus]